MKSIEWTGGRISRAGVYSNMPLDRYHTKDVCESLSISSSGLRKIFHESPAHYWCTSPHNDDRIEEEPQRHFILGRAMHHLIMGEPYFAKIFRVAPPEVRRVDGTLVPWSLRTNEAKAWMDAERRRGIEVIYPGEVKLIEGMALSLKEHPMVQAGAFDGYVERSIFWKDRETGVWLKVRPDVIPTDSGDCVDLKTTTSVQWDNLQRTIAECGYAQQFALMREGFAALNMPFASATLVFVEKTPPYCTRVVSLRSQELDRGMKENRAALRTFLRCMDSGEWPGPGGVRSDAEEIRLPDWANKQSDAKLRIFGDEA
jgi:hypothetical protein